MSNNLYKLGWPVEPLVKHTAVFETGSRPRGGVSKYTEGIPSISAEQISEEGTFKWDNIKYVPEEFFKKAIKGIIKVGDILIVKDGATTGKCAFVDHDFSFKKAMINEHTYLLRTQNRLLSKYAFYFLKSHYCENYFEHRRKHGVIGGLNNSFINDIKLPVPPLSEQRRIVDRIDKLTSHAEKARRLRQDALLEASNILGSCIEQVVSNVSDEYVPLRAFLLEGPRNGWSPKADNQSVNGIPVLTLSAVTGFRYDGSKIKWTTAKANKAAHYWLKPGELLITRSNTLEFVGHAAIYDGEPHPCICPDLIMKMTVRHEIADTMFIHYWLQSTMVRHYIIKNARGTSGSMKKINQSHVKNIPIPKTSLSLQLNIVKYLNRIRLKIDEMLNLQKKIESELTVFTAALLAKAFRGEL